MEKLNFDSGIQEFQINDGGVLRFNPADPNVYVRFLEAADKIGAVEKQMLQKASQIDTADAPQALQLLREADIQIKDVLNWVFGGNNDFDKLLGGTNLLARTTTGEAVVTHLLRALEPVVVAGARSCAKEKAEQACKQAKARRASQC